MISLFVVDDSTEQREKQFTVKQFETFLVNCETQVLASFSLEQCDARQ